MKNNYYRPWTALMLAALLLAGCGGKGFDASSGETEVAQIADGNAGYSGYEEAAEAKEVSAEDVMEDGADAGGPASPEISGEDLSSRKLIKTVSLTMQTKAFDKLKTELEESIASFGGYIEDSSYDNPGGQGRRYYYLCVRIPTGDLDAFVNRAGDLGTITNKSENVRDVTLDYVDKTAYKDSLKTEYERVMELLEKAEDLDQILALESKLSELRYEINSYESQLRTYDNQIDYSTVNINISEVEYEAETSDSIGSRISNGFRGSLVAVRDFFVNAFVFLVSNLPLLILLAAAAGLAALLVKKARKRFDRKASENKQEQRERKERKNEKDGSGSEPS